MYFVQQIRKSYSRLGGIYTLKPGMYEKWALTAVTSSAAHEPIKALAPEKIVEHVRAKVIISSAHPHLQGKRSGEQQILTLSPVKRLKTTTFDGTQHHHHHQPCIIATTTTTPHQVTTADLKATLLAAAAAAQQPRTMTVSSDEKIEEKNEKNLYLDTSNSGNN